MKKAKALTQAYIELPLNIQISVLLIGSGLVYLFFTAPFPLTKFYATMPPVDYTKLTGYSTQGFASYLFNFSLLFSLYLIAFTTLLSKAGTTLLRGNTQIARLIFLGSGTFAVILIFSYPLTAIDMLVYALRSRGWALYGLMPISAPAELFPTADPWLGLAGEWLDATSPYGSIWELLSLGAYHLSSGSYLTHLFIIKGISAASYIGCVWLIYRILTIHNPAMALPGTLFFAWNPLVLFESVQNGHNDILMIFFLLAGIHGLTSSRLNGPTGKKIIQTGFICLLFAFSVLIKFITLVIIPFFILALAKHYRRWLLAAVLSGSLLLFVVVLGMLPYWPGLDNWALLQSGAGRSLSALVILSLKDRLGVNAAFDLVQNSVYVVLGIVYLFYAWRALQTAHRAPILPPHQESPSLRFAYHASFTFFFWYVLLGALVFHAWYMLWFLPFSALLLPNQRSLKPAVVFSMTALVVIPYFETIRVWFPVLLRNHILGHLIGLVILALPPVWAWVLAPGNPKAAQ